MKEKRRIWVVICGAFRLEIELYHVIALLCEWRSQGLLEGIVISTWKGEAEKLPGIRRKLEYLDIPLLESIPLNDSEGKYTNLNYARQAIQLNAALNCIPDDVFVLKCRTDFCIEQLNAIKSYLYKDMSVRSMGCFEVPIRYKIVVMMISVSLPFFINDIVFFGYKPDIRRMLVFENTFYGIGKVRPPEYCFFQSIFAGLYPVINDYIRIIDTYSVRNMVRDRLSAFSDESFYLPGILNKFYALYFSLLYYLLRGGHLFDNYRQNNHLMVHKYQLDDVLLDFVLLL